MQDILLKQVGEGYTTSRKTNTWTGVYIVIVHILMKEERKERWREVKEKEGKGKWEEGRREERIQNNRGYEKREERRDHNKINMYLLACYAFQKLLDHIMFLGQPILKWD